jgi:deoxyribodipyrimidine photo-lyase
MPDTQKIIVWFRNDLRIHDHEALFRANQANNSVVPIYVFDPRQFIESPLGFQKTGALRTQFLLEAVQDLRANLQKIGADLIVRIGKPEEILPELAQTMQATALYTSEEVTQEEIDVDTALEKELKKIGVAMRFYWMSTLYHLDDLPFEIAQLPDVFTQFRNKTERSAKLRSSFDTPTDLNFDTSLSPGPMPELSDLGIDTLSQIDPKSVLPFVGGETAALARLNHYLWEADCLKTYKLTRNEMLGADYSSKFSVWLSLGCISPRTIAEAVALYETQRVKNESTYWLIFELIWRDYFRFTALKFGNKLFVKSGFMNTQKHNWKENKRIFEQWRLGQTGFALIDANMQELLYTGFMSNRGRQNINWLWGAAWFESQLIDYDVCSNYGNWQYVAGVGNDPREDRYFNIHTQATRYDANGQYVKHWLPELSQVPASKVHQLNLLTKQEQKQFGLILGVDYPNGMVDLSKRK